MASKETIRSIWTQIENNRVRSISGRYFVPPSSLATILTAPAISKAVAELECEPEDRINLARTIQFRGRLIFAILIWMHEADAIVAFQRHRCLDSRLPLDEATAKSIVPNFGATFANDVQWQFQPYCFRRNEDVEIGEAEILPYIQEARGMTQGGFGTLIKLEIHPSLQDFNPLSVKVPLTSPRPNC
jgi:hypothetical protein